MKQTLLLLAGLLCATGSIAQRTCGTDEYVRQLELTNPEFVKSRQQVQQRVSQWLATAENAGQKQAKNVVTIPVVFHVVYKTAAQNVPDAQLLAQLQRLNQDYRKLNADVSQTPAIYAGLAADTEIEFCLAQRDPQGNPTTGITRTSTTVNSFNLSDAVKFSNQGGVNAWNPSQYLNIWVCNLGSGLLGYATPPGTSPNYDGVVLLYSSLPGGSAAPYNQGRTATHELGHYFNLDHIWGSGNGGNCASDGIADTPTQNEPNYGCPSFPSPSCNNSGDMSMNYMDYTNDACMYMFTTGQKNAMLAAINTSRPGLLTSLGCVPPTLAALDASVVSISYPGNSVCAGSFSPKVTVKNSGQNTITSLSVNYSLNGGATSSFTWTGSIASQATTVITLPSITINPGAHNLTVILNSPNGGTDGNMANNAANRNFTAISQAPGITMAAPQSFEQATFPPAGYQLTNTAQNYSWERTSSAAKTGNSSMFVNNYNANSPGNRSELVMPTINLSAYSVANLTFEVAHKTYTNSANNPDSLEVLISTDCGSTFVSLYKKGGAMLATGSGSSSQGPAFVPASASDWRKETINLAPYLSSSSAIIKFRAINRYGNNLYLDDILVDGSLISSSPAEILNQQISLYPNPAQGIINLKFINADEKACIEITDMLGRVVTRETALQVSENTATLHVNHLSNGVYIARISNGATVITKQFVISK